MVAFFIENDFAFFWTPYPCPHAAGLFMAQENDPEKIEKGGDDEGETQRDFFNLLLQIDARLHPERYRKVEEEKEKHD